MKSTCVFELDAYSKVNDNRTVYHVSYIYVRFVLFISFPASILDSTLGKDIKRPRNEGNPYWINV